MKVNKFYMAHFVLWLSLLCMPLAWSAEPPAEANSSYGLVKSMTEAMRDKNYSGTFIYRHADKLETLKITHRRTSQGVNEKLVALSGEPREILRDEKGVICVWPKNRVVVVDKNQSKSQFPGLVPDNIDRVREYYRFELGGADRIADRNCKIVNIVSKDQFRFSYRLWIDANEHLLVKSQLLDDDKVIEEVIFTQLDRHDKLPDSIFESQYASEDFKRHELKGADSSPVLGESLWQFKQLPAGFAISVHQQRVRKQDNALIEHMVLSDGLAAVSVFVSPAGMRQHLPAGSGKRGAINSYSTEVDKHTVTVMGEVPAVTVRYIAEGVKMNEQHRP
ncbi:MAG: MucB/RseB C-terminal domain-containing protein [Gammaproteobacteria bacterium]|nr:MucB/RseB C-terminal domain-containing protein [Gammaproteobacteria bacterium]